MELKVYSTIAGAIPLMVRKGEAGCFIPYEQGVELQKEIAKLNREMRKMAEAHVVALEVKALEAGLAGYDRGRQLGAIVAGSKVDQVTEMAKSLQLTAAQLLAFVEQNKEG